MTQAPAPQRRTLIGSVGEGIAQIVEGARSWRIWYLMGSAEMRRRFDRSKLGPVWIAISTGVMVLSIGLLWSVLWSAPVNDILPFMAIGLVTWQFLSGVINDATLGFPSYSGYFANQYMAPSNVIFAGLYKNLVTYLINLSVPILVCLAFGVQFTLATLLFFPGLLLLLFTTFWAAYIAAIFCARYRDVIQIVQNLMQLGFFLTPILWTPETIGPERQHLVYLNPLASIIAVVRDPLLGRFPEPASWQVALISAAVLMAFAIPLIGRSHRRIVYWL
ncbi:MAG: ABC transporter permease [Caulobacteraceae bacterium]